MLIIRIITFQHPKTKKMFDWHRIIQIDFGFREFGYNR